MKEITLAWPRTRLGRRRRKSAWTCSVREFVCVGLTLGFSKVEPKVTPSYVHTFRRSVYHRAVLQPLCQVIPDGSGSFFLQNPFFLHLVVKILEGKWDMGTYCSKLNKPTQHTLYNDDVCNDLNWTKCSTKSPKEESRCVKYMPEIQKVLRKRERKPSELFSVLCI